MHGLYFITQAQPNASSYQSILERISRVASSSNAPSLPPWQLIHHLCMETSSLLPSSLTGSSSTNPRRYLQFLALPHHRHGSMYVGSSTRAVATQPTSSVSDASRTMTIISIPAPQAEEFFQTIQKKMEPLWSYRMAIRVDSGVGYDIGDWTVRIGEIRVISGGQQRTRGVVVEASLASNRGEAGDDAILAPGDRDALFNGLWKQLGLQGGRSLTDVPGMAKEPEHLDKVRLYMELLKFARVEPLAKA